MVTLTWMRMLNPKNGKYLGIDSWGGNGKRKETENVARNVETMSRPWTSCCFSVTQSYLTLCNPMDSSKPGFPVLHRLPGLVQTHVHSVGDAIQPSHPLSSLLLLPSIFPSIRVFSTESALHIMWPKYWSFSFSISPSNEYSGLISFRTDWFHLLVVQGLSRVFSSTTVQKHQFVGAQPSLCSISHICTWLLEKS